jgi:hypothetical protein
VESALNVVVGLPVCSSDGETLISYDSGLVATGTTGVITEADSTLYVPPADYTFSSDDLGSTVVVTQATQDYNIGSFIITSVDTTTNKATLDSSFGFKDDTVTWELTKYYAHTLTTNVREYKFPYNVPMRDDVQDAANYNTLTFDVFESFTTAFSVVDYLEDATWWHDKFIPYTLWPDTEATRRWAGDGLYALVTLVSILVPTTVER